MARRALLSPLGTTVTAAGPLGTAVTVLSLNPTVGFPLGATRSFKPVAVFMSPVMSSPQPTLFKLHADSLLELQLPGP